MFSSNVPRNLAFVSRQLAGLAPDQPLQQALQKIADNCPPEYAADVEYFRNLLGDDDAARPRLGLNPYGTLRTLMKTPGARADRLLCEFVNFVQHNKVLFETYWAGIVGLMWYLAAVVLVTLSVGTTFALWVAPSFSAAFSDVGSALPAFTRIVLGPGGSGLPLLMVLLVIVSGAVVFCVVQLHRRVQRLTPLPAWPRWLPVIGRLSVAYNINLFLHYARMLRTSGVNESDALSRATQTAGLPGVTAAEDLVTAPGAHGSEAALAELGIAASLGNFDAELEHQCEEQAGRLAVVLVEARDRFALALKATLFLFVAALVVAMYLPLFQLGSTI